MATTRTIYHLTRLKSAVDSSGELADILAELAQVNPNNQKLADALSGARAVNKVLKEQLGNVEQAIENRMNS